MTLTTLGYSVMFAILILMFFIFNRRGYDPISFRKFKYELQDIGLSNDMMMFCTELVLRLQKEQSKINKADLMELTPPVIKRIYSWDYSQVMTEEEYHNVYEGNHELFDKMLMELCDETDMSLDEVSEHIEMWSMESRCAEVVLTNAIAIVLDKHYDK